MGQYSDEKGAIGARQPDGIFPFLEPQIEQDCDQTEQQRQRISRGRDPMHGAKVGDIDEEEHAP